MFAGSKAYGSTRFMQVGALKSAQYSVVQVRLCVSDRKLAPQAQDGRTLNHDCPLCFPAATAYYVKRNSCEIGWQRRQRASLKTGIGVVAGFVDCVKGWWMGADLWNATASVCLGFHRWATLSAGLDKYLISGEEDRWPRHVVRPKAVVPHPMLQQHEESPKTHLILLC